LTLSRDLFQAHLFDPVAHALIDHLLLIESEMAQIRQILVEEVMP
jgi:hypothetical protein